MVVCVCVFVDMIHDDDNDDDVCVVCIARVCCINLDQKNMPKKQKRVFFAL